MRVLDLVNGTGKNAVIYGLDDQPIEILSVGKSVRLKLKEKKSLLERIEQIPVIAAPEFTGYDDPDGLLALPTKAIIVSMPVAQYLAQHGVSENPNIKVYSLDTSPLSTIRDASGNAIGVYRLMRWK